MIFKRDDLSNVICNIRIPTPKGEETGTGIFIEKNNIPYLLTAEHVVKNINPQSYVILSDNGEPIKVMLDILLGGSTFAFHEKADLAKAKITITADNEKILRERCFPFNQIEVNNNLISKDIQLTTIGFPLGLGANSSSYSPLGSVLKSVYGLV